MEKLFENIRGRGFFNLATMILPDLGGISVFACWDRVFEFQTQGSIPKRQRIDLTHLLTFLSIYVQMTLKFSNFLSFIFITLTLKGFPQREDLAPDEGVKNPSGNKLVTAPDCK